MSLSISTGPVLYLVCQIIVILMFGLFATFKHGTEYRNYSEEEEKYAAKIIKNHYAAF